MQEKCTIHSSIVSFYPFKSPLNSQNRHFKHIILHLILPLSPKNQFSFYLGSTYSISHEYFAWCELFLFTLCKSCTLLIEINFFYSKGGERSLQIQNPTPIFTLISTTTHPKIRLQTSLWRNLDFKPTNPSKIPSNISTVSSTKRVII